MLTRFFKPTFVGFLVLLPLLGLQLLLASSHWRFSPDGSVESSWAVGVPFTILSHDSQTGWAVHPAGLATLVAALLAGDALLSIATCMVASTLYWGYPWNRPDLPKGIAAVRWTHASPFASDEVGHGWRLVSQDQLSRDDEDEDTECCRTKRIFKAVDRSALEPLDAETAISVDQVFADVAGVEFMTAPRMLPVVFVAYLFTGCPLVLVSLLLGAGWKSMSARRLRT